jgi:putative heme-binding domain-containing protein
LAGVRNGGKEKLLTNILDPNREVPPNYFGYVVDTAEGESHTGLIVNETANSIILRQAMGTEVVVPRSRISRMQASRQSLMPEGLEEGLSHQNMADLMEFIFAQ